MSAKEKAPNLLGREVLGAGEKLTSQESIPKPPAKVNVLYGAMIEARMTGDEVVDMISAKYEGFTKSLLSKVLYPERYGVTLIPDALYLVIGEPSHKEKKREWKIKLGVRLTPSEVAKFREYSRKDGFDSDQAHLAKMIRDYIKRRDKQNNG